MSSDRSDSRDVVLQWLRDGLSREDQCAVAAVYLIANRRTGEKGTAFLIDDGWLITAQHVVTDARAADLMLRGSDGAYETVKRVHSDAVRDLALLEPAMYHTGGLRLADSSVLAAGCHLRTWGHPLFYSGPAPLLSVCYLSGFAAAKKRGSAIKHLVVNGAFNAGNSGGPLLNADGRVVGVVIEKTLPQVDQSTQNALAMMAANPLGEIIERVDESGRVDEVSDSELLAYVLQEIIKSGQVMIGEAVAVEELRAFIANVRRNL